MPELAGTEIKLCQTSWVTRGVGRVTTSAGFADRNFLAFNVKQFALQNPDCASGIIKSLAGLGIVKYRQSQNLKTIEDIQALQVKDFSPFVSVSRHNKILEILTGDKIEVGTVERFGVGTRISNSVSDAIFGIRSALRNAQEITGQTSSPENDPMLAAKPAGARKAALGLMIAFASGTLYGCLGVGALSTPALAIAGLGVVGFGLLSYGIKKSPAFRDTFVRSLHPILTLGAGLGVNIWLAGILPWSGVPYWLAIAGAQLATVIGMNLARNLLAHLLPRRILGFGREASFYRKKALLENDPLVKAHGVKRDMAFDFILRLRDVINKRLDQKIWPNYEHIPTFEDVKQYIEEQVRICTEKDSKEAAKDIKIIINSGDEKEALEKLEEYHIEHTREIPDLKVSSLLLTTGARTSRIFSWACQIPIFLAYTSGNFSPLSTMLFTAFALSNLYYHVGTSWSMKLIESAEQVENTPFPKYRKDKDGKEIKPKIVTVRYSNKGLLNRKHTIPFMVSDIENRVISGKEYYVVLNNDSPNHYTFEVYGGLKMMQKIEARMHYMKKIGLFDTLMADEKKRELLLFILSSEEYEKNPMELVDNAINQLFPTAPAGGEAARMRDGYSYFYTRFKKKAGRSRKKILASKSIGDGGGEVACYLALKNILENDPYFKNGRRDLKDRLDYALEKIIVRENRLDLLGIQDPEKIEEFFTLLVEQEVIDSVQKEKIKKIFEEKKDDYLLETLEAIAQRAGMDAHRAHGIAYEIVKRTKKVALWSKIAPLSDKLILGLNLFPDEENKFKDLIGKAFGIDGKDVFKKIKDNAGIIEQNAKNIIEMPDVPAETFFKTRRYAQIALALTRQGPKSEEGNLRRKWEYFRNSENLTEDEKGEFQFLKDSFLSTFRGYADKASDRAKKRALKMMAKRGVKLAKERGIGLSKEDIQGLLADYTRGEKENPVEPKNQEWLGLLDDLIVENVLGIEKDRWRNNTSAGLLIARRMQMNLINRGWIRSVIPGKLESGKKRKLIDHLCRSIGHAIAKAAAEHQPIMADYTKYAEENPLLSREAVERKVWDKFIEKLDKIISCVVMSVIREYKLKHPYLDEKEMNSIIRLAQECAKEEFCENNNEIMRVTIGLLHQFTHDLKGVKKLEERFKNDTELEELYRTRERCSLIKEKIDEALKKIKDLLEFSEEEKNKIINKLYLTVQGNDIKSLLDTGIGNIPSFKGYNLLYERLIAFIPKVVVGEDDLTITRKGKWTKHRLTISSPKREGMESVKPLKKTVLISEDVKKQFMEALEQLIEAELMKRKLKQDIQIWAYSQLDLEKGNNGIKNNGNNEELLRLVSEPASQSAADFIVNELVKNPLTEPKLSEKAVEIVNNMVKATAGNPIEAKRKEILDEIYKGLPKEEVELSKELSEEQKKEQKKQKERFESFDSVYRYSRIWGFRWFKAKAENTNREIIGSRVHEQDGVILRYLIKQFFTEKLGFFRVPTFLSEKIRIEVIDLLRFYLHKNKDFWYKFEKGLSQDDIARKLMQNIASGTDSKRAADEAWKEIEKAFNENEAKGGKAREITRDYNRVGRMESIRQNLFDCASEVAILYYGARVVERLYKEENGEISFTPVKAAEYLDQLCRDKLININQKKKLTGMIHDEYRQTVKEKHLLEKIKQAREAGNLELSLELEQRLRYQDEKTDTYAAYYRHKTKRPELMLGRSRSLRELASWMNSLHGAPDYTVENGELVEDGKLIRRCAEIGDNLLKDISEKSVDEITHQYNLTEREVKLLKEGLADSQISLFKDINEEKGKALEERTEIFIRILSLTLQAEEKKERKAKLEKESDLKKTNLDKPIVNCLDEKRFPKPAFEQVKGDVQMNADTDNTFYSEILNAAAHYGYLGHGLFINPNEVLQYGCNYEIPFRSSFGRFQRNRDLGGPQNQSPARAALTTIGKTRWRASLIEYTGTLTGYANFLTKWTAMQAASWIDEYNNATTSYPGQKTLERVLGRKWWEVGDPSKYHTYNTTRAKFNYWFVNRPAQVLGWENGWDTLMSGERWLRIIPGLAFTGLALAKVVNFAFGSWFGGNTSFDPAPLDYEFYGHKVGLGTIGLISLGLWAAIKGITWAAGRSIDCYQHFRGRRIYVTDPSEDLATSAPFRVKGHKVTLLKGMYEMNDAMMGWDEEMFQKLRWQAQNAANIWRMLSYIWDYRKVLTFKESFDLLQGPLYNMFGLPGVFNRWAILLFVLAAEPSILIDKSYAFFRNNLEWIVELGFVNYLCIEFMLRISRMKAGASWGGVGLNFGYQTTMEGFNYMNVMRRAMSKAKFGFNVTDPTAEPQQSSTWGLTGVPRFLMKNKFMMGLEGYALYRLLAVNLKDSLENADFWMIYMSTLIFWIGLRTYNNIRGHRLNGGITNIETEPKWEEKNKVWSVGWGGDKK